MRLAKLYISTIALMILAGCAGRNFNEYNVVQLQTGVTTPEQAEMLLGESYDGYTDDKGSHLTWMYAQGGGMVPKVKTLQLRFNNNVLTCVRVLSGFDATMAEQANLVPCPETIKHQQ